MFSFVIKISLYFDPLLHYYAIPELVGNFPQ